ncbi:Galactose oxidase/kelch, beta-propeller [Parasponia andersonii]|uniref:Galactose oxidase/kelch, beta-propeller n=1 Tax=Parasponia andersonii TaxID=3476 RepID=A0A2P5AJ77_PARAD|nr:Galactose oxidase/kelch, beta-propeller [Parasponia andersonii]
MVVMFDRTDFSPSNISLGGGRCWFDPADTALQVDCTAHSVFYDVASNSFQPLMVQTDLWFSSGAFLPNGTLVQTGGYNDGDHVIRAFTPCINDICDWIETPNYLAERRCEPRNYPSSGSSVLLPLDQNKPDIEVKVMICSGAPRRSHRQALEGTFGEAVSSCGRLKVSDRNPSWEVEYMPISRVMGDMVILPSGDIIIIIGAEKRTAGWEASDDPVTTPVIYRPTDERNNRFWTMEPLPTLRLCHSMAVLLPDGQVPVGGSNPHVYYNFTRVKFPTELSLESFSPPYLSVEYRLIRPRIIVTTQNPG